MRRSDLARLTVLSIVGATLALGRPAFCQNCIADGDNPPRPVTGELGPPSCGEGSGDLLSDYTDADGRTRYACLSAPKLAALTQSLGVGPVTDALEITPVPAKLPLVVFLHPSLFTPDTVYSVTNLPEAVDVADLRGDGQRGFILLSPQGRNTEHFYPYPDASGAGWDNWYRPANPADNTDVATIDYYIQEIVDRGIVDTDRIFVTGWSNGSAMAIYYGQARPNLIAAIGVYSSPNPYGDFNDPCPADLTKLPTPRRPLLHIHNDCDIGGICQSGLRMGQALHAVGVPVEDQLLNSVFQPAAECVALCRRDDVFLGSGYGGEGGPGLDITLGSVNHLHWPMTWTASLLHFFQMHPKK